MSDDLFDLGKGEAAKDWGMALAANNRSADLSYAQWYARKLAAENPNRECDADEVQRHLLEKGIDLGNASGSIFKGSGWEFTGKFKKSHRVSRHANIIRIWRLNETSEGKS